MNKGIQKNHLMPVYRPKLKLPAKSLQDYFATKNKAFQTIDCGINIFQNPFFFRFLA